MSVIEKQFKTKLNSLKRIKKDLVYYNKELLQQQEKIKKMHLDGKDEYEIRKQEEVQQETEVMIPDCEKRLVQARDELKTFMNQNEKDEIASSEAWTEAVTILEEISMY